jgi:hypothetical protein
MDISPQADSTQKPMSDDQELAKALAGVIPDAPTPDPVPSPTPVTPPVPSTNNADSPSSPVDPAPSTSNPMQFEETPAPVTPSQPSDLPNPSGSSDLDSIKKDALGELRPLIDKVDLPAEEKFDTYLMLIRSTDDTTLIGPAHAAAQGISDEKRRAEALLDIVKEIDYLSRDNQLSA